MSADPVPNSYWVLPGLLAAGEYPGAKSVAEARPKLAQLLAVRIRVFVDLTEAGELFPYADILREEATRIGAEVEWHRMPIPDVSVPTQSQMKRIQRSIADAIERGRPSMSIAGVALAGRGRSLDATWSSLDCLAMMPCTG